ncbi:MAG: BsuBI/PstI family type II restriction endonuclease [Clostridiales bacterium]
MSKLEEAKGILSAIGMPRQQTNDRSAYVLLSLAGIRESDTWTCAQKPEMRIVDMMNFMSEHYGKVYKPNTRETIRKDTIHQFVDGAVAERNTDSANRPTNSPNYCYCLTNEMLELIKTYGTGKWQRGLEKFISEKGTLVNKYSQMRDIARVPVVVNGQKFSFSPGDHNALQKAIIEEFASRFAKGAEVLYVGDAENKALIKNREALESIGVRITDHDKLPDVVLYASDKNWIYFIEAVTSVGPISIKRMQEIEDMTARCTAGRIYVTAFPNTKLYKKFIDQLAWESEVWIEDNPDHMIHLNGDKFIGPREIILERY